MNIQNLHILKEVAGLHHLAGLLRDLRIEAGLTQIDLAARIEKHQVDVSRYESGQRKLDVLEVREICQAIGITLEEFAKKLESALKQSQ